MAVNPKELKAGDIVVHHGTFYEVDEVSEKVRLFTLTSSIISYGGTLSFDSPQWPDVSRPKGKRQLAEIAAIQARRERTMPTMHHDAIVLPSGEVHVQNWISGMCGGMGQHHVHTAGEFDTWKADIDPKYLTVKQAERCGCGLTAGQTREYNGTVW